MQSRSGLIERWRMTYAVPAAHKNMREIIVSELPRLYGTSKSGPSLESEGPHFRLLPFYRFIFYYNLTYNITKRPLYTLRGESKSKWRFETPENHLGGQAYGRWLLPDAADSLRSWPLPEWNRYHTLVWYRLTKPKLIAVASCKCRNHDLFDNNKTTLEERPINPLTVL